MSRRIKVFTAGCDLCRETLDMVRDATKGCGCEVMEVRCSGRCEEAIKYGVRAMPTVVVDDVIVFEGKPTPEQARVVLERW